MYFTTKQYTKINRYIVFTVQVKITSFFEICIDFLIEINMLCIHLNNYPDKIDLSHIFLLFSFKAMNHLMNQLQNTEREITPPNPH